MRYFCYSTLTNDHKYTNWARPDNDPRKMQQIIGEPVFIKGGANRASDPALNKGHFTPRGVCTEINEKQYEYIQNNSQFQKHVKRGFVIVLPDHTDADKIAHDHMNAADKSAPLTPDSPQFQDTSEDSVKPMGPLEKIGKRIKDTFS